MGLNGSDSFVFHSPSSRAPLPGDGVEALLCGCAGAPESSSPTAEYPACTERSPIRLVKSLILRAASGFVVMHRASARRKAEPIAVRSLDDDSAARTGPSVTT